jgi:hypothetical protein
MKTSYPQRKIAAYGVLRQAGVESPMSIENQSAASRQFVASAPAASAGFMEKYVGKSGRGSVYMWLGFAAFAAISVLSVVLGSPALLWGMMAVLLVLSGVWGVYFFMHSRRKFVLTLTGDGLSIDRRPGDVYSFADAQLGAWVQSGVALHLQSGRRRFLLGGKDGRVGPAAPLDAPPVQAVDAYLSNSDFDQLLSLSGRWSSARAPRAGEPTRCLLFPNPLLIQSAGPFAFRKKHRLTGSSLLRLQLVVDFDGDAIRVIDPASNAVTASASLARVTAAQATYKLRARGVPNLGLDVENVAEGLAEQSVASYLSTMPGVAVGVPGIKPLTIGCREFKGMQLRFSWRGRVPVTNDPPDYAVSAADWLTLTEKLGLSSSLKDVAADLR